MQGINKSSDCLTYHLIQGVDWRREMPELDRTIENCIEALLDGDITSEDFGKYKSQFMNDIRTYYGSKKLSLQAADNYIKILQAVIEEYKEVDENGK